MICVGDDRNVLEDILTNFRIWHQEFSDIMDKEMITLEYRSISNARTPAVLKNNEKYCVKLIIITA